MQARLQCLTVGLVVSGVALSTAYAVKPEESAETIAKGKAIFERVCVLCHGVKGKGDGPAAFFIASYSAPRPRDFTTEGYKFRSTPSGQLPTDQDLFRTITNGVPGYMPPFVGLTEEERWYVVAYVKTLTPEFKDAAPQSLMIPFPAVPSSPASIARGRTIYLEDGCADCHGDNARGEGPLFLAGDLKESSGLPIRPTDLTNPSSFKNGATAHDIFRSLMTGLDGTPMPSYAEAYAEHEEDAWHLINYILSLSREP